MKIKAIVLSLFIGSVGLTDQALPDEVTVQIPTSHVSVIQDVQGDAKFSGKDIQYLTQSGEPMIPYYVERVQLPPNTDLTTVTVSIEEYRFEPVTGEWDVLPIPPINYWDGAEMIIEWPKGKTIVNDRDVDIYENNALFPVNLLGKVSTGQKHTQKLVEVPIALYQYNPVSKKLYHLVEARIVVEFSFRIAVFSTPILKSGIETSNGEEQNSYVIITTNTIQTGSIELTNFIDHKERLGFTVEVVTEDTWGGGTGDIAAENIRNWLQDNYININIEYVLLIGNPHPSLGDVPMKMLWPGNNFPTNKESPSDYYYADLTGNWDIDGDGFYGEWSDDFGNGGVDRYWEVLVGRIPYYGNMDDLDSILAKIIDYEKSDQTEIDWRKNVLIAMKPKDTETPGYHLGEAIKNDIILPKGSWGYQRIYEESYGLNPPPETIPTTVENVTNAWNASLFGAVFWSTHGGPTNANDVMDLNHAATLDNKHPAFTFQASCSTSYPENSSNLAYSLLLNGCVSTIGATRTSFYLHDPSYYHLITSNRSEGLAYGYAKRLIGDGMDCGHSLYSMKQTLIPTFYDSWSNFLTYNIYGDPSTGLFPYVPGPMVIDVPAGDVDALKDAIRQANSTTLGGVINLEAGTYVLTEVDNDVVGPIGLPHIKSPVYIKGDDSELTIIERAVNAPEFGLFKVRKYGKLSLDGLTIKGGSSYYGGAINSDGELIITDCIISNNYSQGHGGGIRSDSILLAFNSIFSDNYSGSEGGGIFISSSSASLINCIFKENEAKEVGGAIKNSNSSSKMINCTFTKNAASIGGAISNGSSSPTITNSILWQNIANSFQEIHNSRTSNPNISYSNIDQNGYAGVNGNIRQNPLFVDPLNSDFHILSNSPCIDTGTNDASDLPDTDFEGDPRMIDGDEDNVMNVDIGADEYTPPCYYYGGDADNDGVCSNFDNCPETENPDQTDSDNDSVGNECDDTDNDNGDGAGGGSGGGSVCFVDILRY